MPPITRAGGLKDRKKSKNDKSYCQKLLEEYLESINARAEHVRIGCDLDRACHASLSDLVQCVEDSLWSDASAGEEGYEAEMEQRIQSEAAQKDLQEQFDAKTKEAVGLERRLAAKEKEVLELKQAMSIQNARPDTLTDAYIGDQWNHLASHISNWAMSLARGKRLKLRRSNHRDWVHDFIPIFDHDSQTEMLKAIIVCIVAYHFHRHHYQNRVFGDINDPEHACYINIISRHSNKLSLDKFKKLLMDTRDII
ncbi:hypothetical protein KVT40_004765 [Elsinoe batatas]|uniref:Uncharacterized protein n=1 Tax=Elsinoe batatas TaxID=2601811 RepID=A0A8K0L1D0_9PEZI|nr:hypothetical protein KVT40_004765 [Elsinoe batatas]